jgi:hypothetical protein
MAATPTRGIRISDELWNRAGARAQRDGIALNEMLRGWLVSYANGLDARPRGEDTVNA